MFAAQGELPLWTQVIDTFGVPVFIVLFGALIIWKLLPHVVDWVKTSTRQAEIVGQAVPRIERNLETIADGSKHIEAVAEAASRTEQKTDAVLEGTGRLEKATTRILDEVRRRKADGP